MQSILFSKYGPPELLKLIDIEKPTPNDHEVLVKIKASSINDWDWGLLRGKPFINKLMFGYKKPKIKTLGADIAGVVESVGKKVQKIKPGDEVFGDLSGCGWGGFAEYVCTPENALMSKSKNTSFEEAAAIPQAGALAVQGINENDCIKPGHKVLINGAGGGSGSFSVQIAKLYGAHITGVDKASKFETMLTLGADVVIDYTKEDFTKNGVMYDLILDHAAYHSIFDYKRSLASNGVYKMVGGSSARIIQTMLLGSLLSLRGNKKIGILGLKTNEGLVQLNKLIESGKVKSIIDKVFELKDVPEAFHYFASGQAKGKVVIRI